MENHRFNGVKIYAVEERHVHQLDMSTNYRTAMQTMADVKGFVAPSDSDCASPTN
jgi:hypothetical protein